jgi:hypothetical protein
MRPLPRIVKIVALLLFIDITLHLNYLHNPHFILLGFGLLRGLPSAALVVLIVVALAILAYFVLKRRRNSYYPLLAVATILVVNSIVNIGALLFVREDTAQFLGSILPGNPLYAYATVQSLILFVNAALLLSCRSLSSVLK